MNTTNGELVKIIESIKQNREEIQEEISAEEHEKAQIEEQMRALNDRLEEIQGNKCISFLLFFSFLTVSLVFVYAQHPCRRST